MYKLKFLYQFKFEFFNEPTSDTGASRSKTRGLTQEVGFTIFRARQVPGMAEENWLWTGATKASCRSSAFAAIIRGMCNPNIMIGDKSRNSDSYLDHDHPP
jgi:hypothetical protein